MRKKYTFLNISMSYIDIYISYILPLGRYYNLLRFLIENHKVDFIC